MSNELTKRQPSFGEGDYDDGIHEPSSDDRPSRPSFLRWTEQTHWIDRNGVPPPSPLLVMGLSESIRRWRTVADDQGNEFKQPQDIFERPLPDVERLNRDTPREEWERQIDGSVSAGWKHEYFVHMLNPGTGETYTWSNSTAGANAAWVLLRDAILVMRALRGAKCYPTVHLSERPMPSRYRPNGMGTRPHFQIIEDAWKTPGGSGALPQQPTPKLTGPAAVSSATNSPAQTPSAATVHEPRPHPVSAPTTKPPSAKTPVKLSAYTRAVMGEVKPVTTEELMNDSLDDLPWDHE